MPNGKFRSDYPTVSSFDQPFSGVVITNLFSIRDTLPFEAYHSAMLSQTLLHFEEGSLMRKAIISLGSL